MGSKAREGAEAMSLVFVLLDCMTNNSGGWRKEVVNQCLEFGVKLVSANAQCVRAQELCESGGGRPGLPVYNSPYGLCGRKATSGEEEEEEVQLTSHR